MSPNALLIFLERPSLPSSPFALTMMPIEEFAAKLRPIQYDKCRYTDRWRVKAVSCRVGDFRRVATRYEQTLQKLPLSRQFSDCNNLQVPIESEP